AGNQRGLLQSSKGDRTMTEGSPSVPSQATVSGSCVAKPKTLAELRTGIASGSIKAADLAVSYYQRIEKVNPRLNIFLNLAKERALEQAARVDATAAKGDPLGPLAGIPVGIKD